MAHGVGLLPIHAYDNRCLRLKSGAKLNAVSSPKGNKKVSCR